MKKKLDRIPFWVWYLLTILPFLAGGFHTYTTTLTAIVLTLALVRQYIKGNSLTIVLNFNILMVLSIVTGYFITSFWASDKGMSPFGFLRYYPLLPLSLLLMQKTKNEKTEVLLLLPWSGVLMTVLGSFFCIIPELKEYVALNGRFSGFLQYPNTFSAFLLISLAIQGTKENRQKIDWILDGILVTSILLSGSRTGFILLILLSVMIAVFRKRIRPVAALSAVIGTGIICCCFINTDTQITFLGRDLGSLFVRLLYYRDALPIILRHPFGLGYMGYRALETTFQTSRYTVSFVHSGLLQLCLDVGWIPSILFITAILKTVFSPKTAPTLKSALIILSAHALVDFDLQFFLFWVILCLCLNFETGTIYQLKSVKLPVVISLVVPLLICIWLGLGDFIYQTGNYGLALRITSFHTDALSAAMMDTHDPEKLDRLADKILHLNPTHALSYSAKANAAYARGQAAEMMLYKEKAIQLTPYSTEEYCDYIEKLYTILQIYERNGDTESAVYCLNKIISVPAMMNRIAEKTDPLAYKTGNNSEVILPEEYQLLISQLAVIATEIQANSHIF